MLGLLGLEFFSGEGIWRECGGDEDLVWRVWGWRRWGEGV